MKLRKVMIAAVLSMVVFTSCQDNDRRNAEEAERIEMDRLEAEREAEMLENEQRLDREANSITSRIEDNRELSSFSQGLNSAEISDDYREDEGPYTVFAPVNSAYEKLNEEQRKAMMDVQNRDRNNATLHYLMVEGKYTEDQLKQEVQNANGNFTLTTMQGEDLIVTLDGENIVLKDAAGNTARITDSDPDASNGVIFVIDNILMPKDPTRNEAANREMNGDTRRDTTSTGNTQTQRN